MGDRDRTLDISGRRRFLKLSGAASLGALAGCTGGGTDGSDGGDGSGGDGSSDGSDGGSSSDGGDGSGDGSDGSGGDGSNDGSDGSTPGNNQMGGPNNLQSSATVDARVLEKDMGAGKFVFDPAVVWVEKGTTVEWAIKGAGHSVTAYHPDNNKPNRIPEGAQPFDSGTISAGESFSHTFKTEGVYNYYCKPHEGLGMVGLVIVGGSNQGPGTQPVKDISGGAASALKRLLKLAGVMSEGGGTMASYTWENATFDSYWYSLYNMSTNIAMSANGVLFPHNEKQKKAFNKRFPAMLKAAGTEKPPIKNPNLNMAPFTKGDPRFTQKPVFDSGDGRPDASTLKWDKSNSSGVVSPASVGWTHLKGVTWAKNFQKHFDILPDNMKPRFRSMVLTTLAQIGIKATLIAGGPQGNGALTKNPEKNMLLVSGFSPVKGKITDPTPRPNQHASMMWFLSDLVSLAKGGWFGYKNPKPLIPAKKLQKLSDGVAKTTMNAFPADKIMNMGSTRDLGLMLGAVGWYGTHAGNSQLETAAKDYANSLASKIQENSGSNGRVDNGASNQAATQGIVGQGLIWASQIDGVDHTSTAKNVLGYMFDELWDSDAGTFASGKNDSTYTITARDAGDVTGGINAAEAELGMSNAKEVFAKYFNNTFNRGRLQRAERPPSRDSESEHPLPLPPKAGGEYGQSAVYNAEVEYDTSSDSWKVTDATFDTEQALYLANQDIWIGQWGGDFYQGRGVPGKSDTPP